MTCAVSAAVREGAQAIVCASTGNTAASAAAYAARGGLRCAVIVPEGKIATGKLAQALAHGARVISLRGNFDTALRLVRELTDTPPDRARQLRQRVPDRGAEDGRVRGRRGARFRARRALHPGRQRRQHHRLLARLSRARAGAVGCSASRPPARRRWCSAHPVEHPETVASAIRIGNPARWEDAMNAMTASGGAVRAVTDEQILSALRAAGLDRGRVLRAGVGRIGRRDARPRHRRRAADRLRADRSRPQGPADRARPGRRGRPVRGRDRRDRAGRARDEAAPGRPGPGIEREPRPGVRRDGGRGRPVAGARGGGDRDVRGRDGARRARPTARTCWCARSSGSRPPTRSGSSCAPRSRCPAGSAHPRPRSSPGWRRPTTCSSSTPTCWRSPPNWRAIRTTSARRCAAAS